MKSENKTSDFSNDKNYIRIVLSRKTLVAAICIILAIALTAFVLHEVFREKYNVTPTVTIVICDAYRYEEGKNGNTTAIYLKYDGKEHYPDISISAEGKELTQLSNYRWAWGWEHTEDQCAIKEKGVYILNIATSAYTQDGKLKYQRILSHDVRVIIE